MDWRHKLKSIWTKYGYTNFHELNVDYFIMIFTEIFEEWEQLYNDLVTWKETTIKGLGEWKDATQEDIAKWEEDTLAALDEWQDAFEELFDSTFENLSQIKEDAEAARDAAQGYAQDAADSATAISSSLTDIATNKNKVNGLENIVASMSGIDIGTWKDGYAYIIPTSVSNMPYNGEVATAGLSCGYMECTEGDLFYITGHGESGAKLYAFTKSNGDIITRAQSNEVGENTQIRAPANAAYLLYNVTTSYPHSFIKGETVINQIKSLEEGKQFLNAEEYKITNIVNNEYYNTTYGLVQEGSGWQRSAELLPYYSEKDRIAFSTCGYHLQLVCFDENMEKISGYATAIIKGYTNIPLVIPKETRYIGVNNHSILWNL